jgi:Ca2+-binding EF-hand superfamily protein
MKLAMIGLSALLSLGAVGSAHAAAYGSTEECLAALGALDVDGDGYVDKAEQADSIKIDANVDSDGDGRISNAEQTVACRTGAITGLKGQEQK